MSTRIVMTHRRQRGFTLAEILVTTAIFAIIMLAALAVYDRSNRVFKTATEAADLQQSTRIGFDKLVADMRMAGFDYNRGGVPTESWQAPQPDEQIEYAGQTAVVFRANFNYNVSAANGNGLEPAYTPTNSQNQPIFPYVTTSNDEIVAYVLRSANASANSQSISFWVDDYQPRAAFPSTIQPPPNGNSPSHPERAVTISGIDLTNNNPPYTLYRVTVSDVHNSSLGTPVAENIRSLNFTYYTDFNGTTLLTNPDGTAVTQTRNADGSTITTSNTGAIGGDGQFVPDNPGNTNNFTDRSQRALIASVRVNLVGMNASPDLQGYTNPTETISSIQGYRQYSLQSLVVPRNLGLTGFPEPSYNPPAPPTITGMCVGHCGAPIIYWQPPSVGGQVIKYHIEWDTNVNGAYSTGIDVTDPTATTAILPDLNPTTDVSLTYYYRMEAVNDNGQSAPSQVYSAVPQNKTKPQAPTNVTVTNNQTNQITLTWVAPTNNVVGNDVLSCSGTGGSTGASAIPPQEIFGFRVYRGTNANFDPAAGEGVQVLGVTTGSQPPQASPGATVTWVDSATTSLSPPAACVTYYYKVQTLDRCYRQANWNVSGNVQDSMSPFSLASSAGQATSTVAPVAPQGAQIDRPNVQGPMGVGIANEYWYIGLQWPKVTQDVNGNAIAVDTYRITRKRRPQSIGGTFIQDPTYLPTDVSGFSQISGGICSWQDRNGPMGGVPYADAVSGPWEYQYTIAAKTCSAYSAESNTVLFPGCSINVTVSQSGSSGIGNGDTPATAYVMASGDTVTITPAVGVTLASVRYDLYLYSCPLGLPCSAGTLVSTQTIANPGPFVYTWVDQTDNDIYQLWMTMTDSTGCTSVKLKYISQEPQPQCAFANVVPAITVLSGHPSSDEQDAVTFSITNPITNTQSLKFNIPSGPNAFQAAANMTWTSPDIPAHLDLQFTKLFWSWGPPPGGMPSGSSTDTICAYNSTCPKVGQQLNAGNLTSSGTTATVVTPSAHGYTTGQVVNVSGAAQAAYNGNFTITVVNSTTFRYTMATTAVSPATGTINVAAQTVISRSVPSTLPDLLPGATLTVRAQFDFDSRHQNTIGANPFLKFCLNYKLASDLARTQSCNVVGQIVAPGTTNNPRTCD